MARTQEYITPTVTNQKGWAYYLKVTPAQSSGSFVSPTSGTTTLPNDCVLRDVTLEHSIDDFPLGMCNPSTLTVTFDLDRLDSSTDSDVQDLAKYLVNPAILIQTLNGKNIWVTNIIELFVDPTQSGTFYRAFVGAQKRTPSVELELNTNNVLQEIDFVHLTHYVLESSRTDEAYTWLQGRTYTSTPFAYNFLWGASLGDAYGTGYTTTETDGALHLMSLAEIKAGFKNHVNDLLQFLWRDAGATFDIEMPQDFLNYGGVAYYKQNFSASTTRGAVIADPLDDLYLIAYTSSSTDPSTTVADRNGGWAYYDGSQNGMFKHPNLWDMFSEWAGVFYCQMMATHDITPATKLLKVETTRLFKDAVSIDVDADNLALETAKFEIPFSALAETDIEVTDSTQFDVSEQRATVKRGTLNEADASITAHMHNQMCYIDSEKGVSPRSFLRGRDDKLLIYYQGIFNDFTRLYYQVSTDIATDSAETIAILPHPDVVISDYSGTVYTTTNSFTAFPTATVGRDLVPSWLKYNNEIQTEVLERETLAGHPKALAEVVQSEFGSQTQYKIDIALTESTTLFSDVGYLLQPNGFLSVAFEIDLDSISGGRGFVASNNLNTTGKAISASIDIDSLRAEVEVFVRQSTTTPT